jgi:hypothetical protein
MLFITIYLFLALATEMKRVYSWNWLLYTAVLNFASKLYCNWQWCYIR